MQDLEKLFKQFKKNAEKVSAKVFRVNSLNDVFLYVKDLVSVRDDGTIKKTIAAPGFPEDDLTSLKNMLGENSHILVKNFDQKRDRHIDVGLTYAEYGIAETGSLVLNSGNYEVRIASMLSNHHIALIPYSGLRNSSEDLIHEFNKILEKDAAYLSFITGPSRTADIERILVTGVHGPLALHIFVLEDK